MYRNNFDQKPTEICRMSIEHNAKQQKIVLFEYESLRYWKKNLASQ